MSTPDALRHDIEMHREGLAETVDLLADKLDVKARAAERIAPAKPYALPAAGGLVAVLLAVVLWRRRS